MARDGAVRLCGFLSLVASLISSPDHVGSSSLASRGRWPAGNGAAPLSTGTTKPTLGDGEARKERKGQHG
jgi:hypothetical protein